MNEAQLTHCRYCGAVTASAATTTRIDQVPGLEYVKRGLEVAIAGEHTLGIVAEEAAWPFAATLAAIGAQHGITVRLEKPCPCGNYGSRQYTCTCTRGQIARHQRRKAYRLALASDIVLTRVVPPRPELVLAVTRGQRRQEPDETILERAAAAIDRDEPAPGGIGCDQLIKAAHRSGFLTAASLPQALAVAATIARLGESARVEPAHLAEALQYRPRPGAM